MSSCVMSPREKETAGYVLRATATISGDRSTPNAAQPRPWRCAVTCPGPQPRSATGPETVSANAASNARSSGLPASSSPNNAAYVSATASYERRVASRGSTRRTVVGSPDKPAYADNRHYVNLTLGGVRHS